VMWLAIIAAVIAVLAGSGVWTAPIVRRAERRYPPSGKFVEVEGYRLHYVEVGSGQPVVLLHGDSGSVLDFTLSPLVAELARDYHVFAFDRPGLGYSQRPRAAGSPFVQARMIYGALRTLGVKNPVLVGHSRGGPVCLALGVDHPAEIAGVVNVAGGAYYQGGGPSFFNLLTIPILGSLLANTVAIPFGRGVVKMTLDIAFSPDRTPPPQYLEAYSAMELRPTQLTASADDIVNSVPGMRLLIKRYPEITFLLVSVHGEADRNVAVASSQQLHRQVPSSGLIIVPNSGHEVMFNHPEAQWDIPDLRRLLEDILPSNSHFDDFEVTHDFEHIGRRTMLLNARRIHSEDNKTRMILLAMEDITVRRRAEEEARRRTSELEAVHKVSVALRAAQSAEEALPVLLDETLAALRADAGAIWLYDPACGELRAAAARGWFRELAESPMRPGEGIPGTVFSSGEMHISAEFTGDPLTRAPVAQRIPPGWGGACIPIRAAAVVIGVLFVSVRAPRRIAGAEVEVLEALAEMAGAALHRLRLHDEALRRVQQLQALETVDHAITATLDLRITLNVLLEQMLVSLGVDAAGVLLLNPHTLTLEYAAGRGFPGRGYERSRLRLGEGRRASPRSNGALSASPTLPNAIRPLSACRCWPSKGWYPTPPHRLSPKGSCWACWRPSIADRSITTTNGGAFSRPLPIRLPSP